MRHAFVCQTVSVVLVRVANMCPLLVTLMAMMVPCTSSSTDAPFLSSTSLLLCADATSPGCVCDGLSASCSPGCWCSAPSCEVCARPGSVRLVAAKTEGDEIGQYVMAVYRKRRLHLRAPISMRGCMLHEAHASWRDAGEAGCGVWR
jgi:hypothetical protein